MAGVLTAVAFLAAVLAHELGNAVVARHEGLPVEGITLWLLGGVTRIGGEAPTPAAELRITGVGPLISLVLGLCPVGLSWVLHAAGWSHLAAAVGWLGAINVVLAVRPRVTGFEGPASHAIPQSRRHQSNDKPDPGDDR